MLNHINKKYGHMLLTCCVGMGILLMRALVSEVIKYHSWHPGHSILQATGGRVAHTHSPFVGRKRYRGPFGG